MICRVAATAVLALLGAQEARAQSFTDDALPMKAASVRALYSGKTWRWTSGAGYFRPDGKFWAYATDAGRQSYGKGEWRARPDGRMCFSARWYVVSGSKRVTSCFAHRALRIDGKLVIFQRRLPKGTWYIFKHATPDANDESRKLFVGALDWSTYASIRYAVQSRQPNRQSK